MINTSNQVKRKTITDKEVIEFLAFMEEKFENNSNKLQPFMEILNKFNNANEEEILSKIHEIFSEQPLIILELNKILPKSNRLPLVDTEYGKKFLGNLKIKDEIAFNNSIKSLLAYKNSEINIEILIQKFEEQLKNYPELLEEAFLFLDYKRVNTLLPPKKSVEISQPEQAVKKTKVNQNQNKERERDQEPEPTITTQPKQKSNNSNNTFSKTNENPDYVFFESLKNVIHENLFKTLIKLLHLYVEGVLNYHEFIDLVEPVFVNNVEYFEYLKQITYSKMMNRRHTSLINKPLSELDLTKSRRICTSYSEIPKEYPNLICSGRNAFHWSILNDKYISIPFGSEDDKNPLKKNHYEENLFKFEEQRYEIDMTLEYLKYSTEKLQALSEKINLGNNPNINIEEELGNTVIRYIGKTYKDFTEKFMDNLRNHPKDTIPIIISRFKKRIEEMQNSKLESEKIIKPQYEKFYIKSLDYRSLRFKNSEKKNNNPKAFSKEIIQRKKDKLTTNNINILRGGVENFEFYITINLKFFKENIAKTLKQIENSPITDGNENTSYIHLDGGKIYSDVLMNNILKVDDVDLNIKKKLPEFRMIIDNQEYFKLTLALIFYSIFYYSNCESLKIAEYFSLFINNIFNIDTSKLLETLHTGSKNNSAQKNSDFSNRNSKDKFENAIDEAMLETQNDANIKIFNDKDLNYLEVLEQLKNKNSDNIDIDKFYNLDKLSLLINFNRGKEIKLTNIGLSMNFSNKINSENESVISLTPSLESQETGKTYKEIILLDESEKDEEDSKNYLFYPSKNKSNILFFTNEHYYVVIRYIFCIYERLNKLGDSSAGLEFYNQEGKSNDMTLLKNFVTIYKAFLHKKIENINLYEEFLREIIGNESYFLINIDKLINSLIKNLIAMNIDKNCIDVMELFLNEKSRKFSTNENLYFSNFINLMEGNLNSNTFRIMYFPREKIMTFHLLDLTTELNRKDFMENYTNLMENNVLDHDQFNDSNDSDDIFNIYLKRNKKSMEKKRNKINPTIIENNLIFRLDNTCKKFQFLKSGSDILFFKKKNISEVDKIKRVFIKNLKFRMFIENKLNKFNSKE